MNKRKCPFCEQEFNGGSPHIYKCKKRPLELNKNEIKFEFYKFNFPEISNKDILYNEHIINKLSLPELRTKYRLDYKAIQWLMTYFEIEWRNHKESTKIGVEKTKKYFKETFGVENCSQLEEVKEKKRQTFLKHYGVDNIRKWKPFYDYVDKVIEEKYGMSKSEFLRKRSKEVWAKKTDEQKTEWLNKSIHRDDVIRKNIGYRSSKLETRIEDTLKENNITYTHQFLIKETSKKRKYYDFYLPEYKILIEVNGDYWHANPNIYKTNDIIHYCFGHKKAKEIWDKDKIKQEIAESKGYKIIYIWERELNKLETNKQILEHIKSKL
jgi:G:T-mismatch repair DNA endonuclease (very short patch repair protein)